jgi:hypothetical protein
MDRSTHSATWSTWIGGMDKEDEREDRVLNGPDVDGGLARFDDAERGKRENGRCFDSLEVMSSRAAGKVDKGLS